MLPVCCLIGFRPLIRGFFFYTNSTITWNVTLPDYGFRPLIRGFFFYLENGVKAVALGGFRPLIRGFFFYYDVTVLKDGKCILFPSPHSGILFLSIRNVNHYFYHNITFPSPHSGILFLFSSPCDNVNCHIGFPSPHSGILFLLEMKLKDVEVEGADGFRPLIRGFFFYPVVMICRQV